MSGRGTCRDAAALASEEAATVTAEEDPLTDYGGILKWHREQRRGFPPPHRDLTRWEAVRLRQLQTETVLTPALARHVCPELFESEVCSMCARATATLAHIMWGCDSVEDGAYPPRVRQCVGSAEPKDQRWAVQQLEAALALQRRKGTPRGSPSSPSGAGAR